jgi:hypothetical protein
VFIDHGYKEVSQAHYSVLQSTELMQPYIDEHLAIISEERNGHTDQWVIYETTQATINYMVKGPKHTDRRNHR